MSGRLWIPRFLLITLLLISLQVNSQCEFSFTGRNKVFDFNLASSIRNFPHGALSEDGFYRVEANSTVLWFQLCDVLIFNHDPPRCVGCKDCGGPSHCGTSCSALLSENVKGYDVCSSLGHASTSKVDIIDKEDPGKGVIVKMSGGSSNQNCSLSVSVICQKNKVNVPLTLEKSGTCHYATELRHPSGCAAAISGHGSGWGWFSTLLIIILCLFGAYLLGGALYRYFSLGIRGTDVIPNLDFWATVPHRTQSCFGSLLQRFRGSSHGQRTSYSQPHPMVINSSSSSQLLASEERIKSFLELASEASRDDAIAWLNRCKGNLEEAISSFSSKVGVCREKEREQEARATYVLAELVNELEKRRKDTNVEAEKKAYKNVIKCFSEYYTLAEMVAELTSTTILSESDVVTVYRSFFMDSDPSSDLVDKVSGFYDAYVAHSTRMEACR